MSNGILHLSMYDWPEVTAATDHWASCLITSLSDYGFTPDSHLTREGDRFDIWRDPNLLVGQTCGLPYVSHLKDEVGVIGTPAYGISCGAGSYYSVIVTQKGNPAKTLEDLKGQTFAYNETGSQSGYAALIHALTRIPEASTLFTQSVQSGSHRDSLKMVASGKADFAAIDAVTWELACRHEKAASELQVIATTDPTPALPYITAGHRGWKEMDQLHNAVIEAMAALDEDSRDALFLIGFVPSGPRTYHVIEDRHAYSRHMLPGFF